MYFRVDNASPLYSRTRSRSSNSFSASPWPESTLVRQRRHAGYETLEQPVGQDEQSSETSPPALPCLTFTLRKSEGGLFLNMLPVMLSRAAMYLNIFTPD
jgi:hypothetical protein